MKRDPVIKKWGPFAIVSVAAIAVGTRAIFTRPPRQSNEPPSARQAADAARHVNGRMEDLSSAHESASWGIRGAFQDRGSPTFDSQLVVPEEGPLIQVPTRPDPAQVRVANGPGGTPRVDQPADATADPRESIDVAERETGGSQPGAGTGSTETVNTQQATDGDRQTTNGAQAGTEKKADGAQQGTGKTADSDPAEPASIKAKWMDWDPNTAYKGEDGNVHASPGSTLRTEVDLSSPGASVAIWAYADQTQGQWPKMRVSVDGTPMGEVTINSSDEQKYHLPIYADPGHSVIELTPITDGAGGGAGQDQNVHVRKIKIWPQGPAS